MISIIYKLLRLLRIPARLAKGSALNLIAVLFSQGSTLMINIIVARLLMKEAFGEYAMILTTLLTFAAFSQFAIGSTAAKYIAEYRTVDPQKSGRILGLCVLIVVALALIGSLLLLTLTPWVSKSVLNAPHLAKSLCIGIVFLFFTTVNGFQTGVLSGLEAFGGMAKAGIISGLVAVIAIPVGAWQGGINGAVAGLSASSIVRAGVHYWWVKVETRKQEIFAQYKNCFKQEKEILYKFAIPASMSGLYATPMVWISNSLLVRQPGGYGEMALFAAANNFRMLVMFIPKVINNVGLSMLNNLKGTGNKSSFFKLFKTNTLIIFLVSLAAFIFLSLLGRPILGLFGKEFEAGQRLLVVLLASGVVEAVNLALRQYIQSLAKVWHSFFVVTIPRESMRVLSAYFLVKSHGGEGLGIAYLIAMILAFILWIALVFYLYKKTGGQISDDGQSI